MLPLDDPRWKTLQGGYRIPYDASVALRRLEQGEDVWDELWEDLHHQGDIGEASYAAVPHIVRIVGAWPQRDWNPYSIASTIEIERHRKKNPPLPDWLKVSYLAAWDELLRLGQRDILSVTNPDTISSILGALALAKQQVKLGAFISYADDSEIDEYLDEQHAWSEIYKDEQ